jgi:hypothetical protein
MTAFHTRASVLPLNEKHGYFQYADAQGDVSLEFANGAVQLFISLGQEATRAYEQTGLTPAQLQARVAELEGALRELEEAARCVQSGEWALASIDVERRKAREVLNRA